MNILVTGCAGFIASRVAGQLLDDGHEVLGLDNLNDAYDPRLKERRLAALKARPGFTFQKADVACASDLRAATEDRRFDAVVNLAARAGVQPSVSDPHEYVRTNLTGTIRLLELCQSRGIGKFVLASTSSAYGNTEQRPFREDAKADRPLSPYAASKRAAEQMAFTYHHLYGIDVSVLRYFTVYGPAGRPDMSIFRFVRWIVEDEPVQVSSDGLQERDFTFVEDIAAGTCAALKPLGYEIINLGGDQPVSLKSTIEQIEALAGRKGRIEYGPMHRADVRATWADISKARRLLGWSPKTSIADGLAQTVNWYLENRSWARDLELPKL